MTPDDPQAKRERELRRFAVILASEGCDREKEGRGPCADHPHRDPWCPPCRARAALRDTAKPQEGE